jgi:hypothetical protein
MARSARPADSGAPSTDPVSLAESKIVSSTEITAVVKIADNVPAEIATVTAAGTASAEGDPPTSSANAKIILTLPISESSEETSNPLLAGNSGTAYKAKLTGKSPDIKFDGRTTTEQDAGGGTSNCNTKGIMIPPTLPSYFAAPKLSAGCWVVAGKAGCGVNGWNGDYTGQTNYYGDDGITIPTNWITSIIARNPNGCTVTMHQNMLINCDSGNCKYWKNTLVLTINPILGDEHYGGTVSATRSGNSSQ